MKTKCARLWFLLVTKKIKELLLLIVSTTDVCHVYDEGEQKGYNNSDDQKVSNPDVDGLQQKIMSVSSSVSGEKKAQAQQNWTVGEKNVAWSDES